MIVFYFHTSPNPAKIALMLEETGLKYELVPVDTWAGDQHNPNFRRVNPNGKTPAIEDNGKAIFDSNAILLYLAEKTQSFLGRPEERGELLSWLMFVATGIGPFCGQLFHFKYIAPKNEYAINRYEREAHRLYRILEGRVSHQPFILADYSIVDMAAWGWLRLAPRLLGDEVFTKYPKLKAWLDRVDARPAAARAAKIGADIPFKTNFDETTHRNLFPQNFPEATH